MATSKKVLKALVLPRRRGNGGVEAPGLGAVLAFPTTSVQAESELPSEGEETSSIASPLTEISRTVTTYSDGDHDYRVAVQSVFNDANGDEVIINWLDPNSPNITEV